MKAEKQYILLELEYVEQVYNLRFCSTEIETKILKLGVFSSEKKAKEFEESYWATFNKDPNSIIHYIRLPFNP
jgi:hypothetical protein